MIRHCAIYPLLLAVAACAPPLPSSTKVTNGIAVDPADETFRSIVPVKGIGRCTGTFLNDTTLITAHHCLAKTDTGWSLETGGVKAERIFESQRYDDLESDIELSTPYDIILAVFPAGTAAKLGIKTFRSLAAKPAKARDRVQIVGYGLTDPRAKTGFGTERRGWNHLVAAGSVYEVTGLSGDGPVAGENSNIAPGDSGGPLLNADGQIIGLNSYIRVPEADESTHDAFFANALSPASFRLYHAAIRCKETQAPCAADFGGSRLATSGPRTDLCLDDEEVRDWLRLVIARDNDGPLGGDDRKLFDELDTRHAKYGDCSDQQ